MEKLLFFGFYAADSATGDNNLKILKSGFWKEVQNKIIISLYPYSDSLTPAVFYAVKNSIFQDSFCCNFFVGLTIFHSEG